MLSTVIHTEELEEKSRSNPSGRKNGDAYVGGGDGGYEDDNREMDEYDEGSTGDSSNATALSVKLYLALRSIPATLGISAIKTTGSPDWQTTLELVVAQG